jgi:prepilin-type N-terminal cleavage/methylation domain-containing protein/prepilin-type processing-associated H-X9-DG protein
MNMLYHEPRTGIAERSSKSENQRRLFRTPHSAFRKGFTLIELLVLIAIIAILASLLLPALSKAKARGQSIACLNNLKQLQLAWTLYADDHNDRLALNNVESVGASWRSAPGSWVEGRAMSDASATNIERGTLFTYSRAVSIYHCPSDRSVVEPAVGNKSAQLRTRSYNLSTSMSTDWVTQNFGPSLVWKKLGEIAEPSPTLAFTFLDMHEAYNEDGTFFLLPAKLSLKWDNVPGDRHRGGCNLAFADGHGEPWRWLWPKDTKRMGHSPANASDERDLRRLKQGVRSQ